MKVFYASFLFLATSQLAAAAPPSGFVTKRAVSELRPEGYDFVIAGGGTAGLTVADRLSEAFPDSQLKPAAGYPSPN